MPDSPTANAPKPAVAPTPVISAKPVVLPAPGRGEDVQVRVSAPATGTDLPVIVFSHGFGWSMDGYAPLADHWAAHGFVVVQPTHLDSRTLGIPADDPRTPRIWRIRIEDLTRALDGLDVLEAAVPGLAGRVDHDRIAVAGHSWGAQTASTLLGARILGADGVPGEDMSDPRVKAGVLFALTGLGDDLTPFAREHLPFMRPSFDTMTPPSLFVAGDSDQSHLSTRGPDWFTWFCRGGPGVHARKESAPVFATRSVAVSRRFHKGARSARNRFCPAAPGKANTRPGRHRIADKNTKAGCVCGGWL
ncbi:alpha/beta hydrolase family protein [Streptomyces sp. NBC_01361]|uniref:alpha/beta hydrolase family protein n=1 Tax=Streptomyces sp. NBC_01361 TaxID=2903838 RepID=UPI002E3287DE|nr:chlorophyllase [Streptomyces sp. NBC_01361]